MKERKKVLHIVEAFGGGVFTVLNDLINGTSDDYEIVVAYSLRAQTPKNFKEFFDSKVKFIEVKNFTRSINPKKDIKALKEIKRIVKEEKPDIVHLHSSKAGVLGRLAVNGNKIRMFYNPHGFSFLKQDDSKLKRCIYWMIEKIIAIFNRKCTIVGCSKGEYLEAKKLNKNSICIDNGVDIERLNKETVNLKEKEFDFDNIKICTVGRIGYQKNPEMFNKIAEKFPNIQFTWIGEGELRNKLTSSNIEVTGWKSREKVLEILNKQDIFILTSLWEGLPISILEAMYMKKVCIVSDVIGNRDVIIDGENGFICNNINMYKDVINNIKKERYDFKKIAGRAYQYLIDNYSVLDMCSKYIYEYRK